MRSLGGGVIRAVLWGIAGSCATAFIAFLGIGAVILLRIAVGLNPDPTVIERLGAAGLGGLIFGGLAAILSNAAAEWW